MRRALDKFYTNDKAAKRFIEFVKSHVELSDFDRIIEPSAGAGALLKYLPSHTIGIDIEPEAEGIIKHDFLTWEYPEGRTITIGNPPFGVRNRLSIAFFNRAAANSEVIAFVVPAPWEKYSIHRQLSSGWALIANERMPEESFEQDGKPYAVRCTMQVWAKQSDSGLRILSQPDGKNPYFDFVSIDECEFAIRQAYPKTVSKSDIDSQSHYFIKPKVARVFDVFKTIDWQSVENRPLLGGVSVPCLDKETVVDFYERNSPWISHGTNNNLSFLGI